MRQIRTKAEYEALCDEIWHHNRCYFQESAPEISDEDFDKLVVLLEQTERDHREWISPTSPTQRIGEKPLEGFADVTHDEPMLSLKKTETDAKDLEIKLIAEAKRKEEAELRNAGFALRAQEEASRKAIEQEAAAFVRAAIAKTVELSPKAIDETLIAKAVKEARQGQSSI